MRILIIGYGLTGKEVNKYLLDKVEEVYTYDENKEANYNYQKLKDELPLFDLGIKSPGIRKNSKEYRLISTLCKEVISEIDYAYLKLKSKNLIGITGSNGKTTLTKLIYEHLKLKFKTYIAGNIGIPLISLVDKVKKEDYIILELSSFQLEDSKYLRLKKGYITSLSPNHLNYYDDYIHYLSAKKRMLLFCDDVISINDNIFNINVYQKNNDIHSNLLGDYNKIYHNVAFDLAITLGLEKQKLEEIKGDLTLEKYRLNGPKFIKNFKVINDSKSTSKAASLYAYNTFNKDDIILILGGIHKSDSFEEINIKTNDLVYIYGRDKERISKEINGFVFDTLEEVIKDISMINRKCTILFSPGCDSHDQFNNYLHRGEVFDDLVKKYLGDEDE